MQTSSYKIASRGDAMDRRRLQLILLDYISESS